MLQTPVRLTSLSALLLAMLSGCSTDKAQQTPPQTPMETPATDASLVSAVPAATESIVIKNQLTGEDIFAQLTPKAQEVIRLAVAQGPFPDETEGKRKAFNALFAKLSGQPQTILKVEDQQIPVTGGTIPLRLYRPREGKLPVLVYYHGGGFNKGDLESHDAALRALSNRTGMVVVAVAYRRTPEHQYPTQVNDAYAALEWVARNAESLRVHPGKIAVGGDSVGGNLAAVTAQRARDQKGPKVGFQLLFYPVTDVTLSTKSWQEMAQGPWLTREGENEGFSKLYLPPGTDPKQPYVSPLYAPNLKGLPPALVIDAGFDPYRDEGQAYAGKLKAAGVPVTAKVYPGVIHDFILMGGKLPEAEEAFALAATEMNKAFGNP